MTTMALCLEPLDVLFFRDGRPFGASTRAGGALPAPQTLHGAITTALLNAAGCNFTCLSDELRAGGSFADACAKAAGEESRWIADLAVRGPWLARAAAARGNPAESPPELLFPAPATLHDVKGADAMAQQQCNSPGAASNGECRYPLHVARPVSAGSPVPGWAHGQWGRLGLRPLWLSNNEPTEPVSGFLAASAMARFLNGQCVCLEDLVESNALYSHDERTGIGIDPDRLSAAQSLIYGAKFLSLRPARARAADHGDAVDVQFYAEVHLPDGAPDFAKASLNALATLPFGGEGRRVVCRWLKNAFDWSALQPAWPAQEAGRKTFYLLTTPGLFAARWRPACLAGRLVAAAVPGATAVSGWDLARGGPKRTRFAALPGSVYFVDQPVDAFCPSLSDDPQDQRQGWGCFLRGVWIDD